MCESRCVVVGVVIGPPSTSSMLSPPSLPPRNDYGMYVHEYLQIVSSIFLADSRLSFFFPVLLSGFEDDNSGESEEEDGDDSEGDEGGISLMDMLAANEAKLAKEGTDATTEGTTSDVGSGAVTVSKSKKSTEKDKTLEHLRVTGTEGRRGKRGGNGTGSEDEHSLDADDEESISAGDDDDGDDDDPMDFAGDSSDDDDDGDDEEERHAKLLGFMGTLGDKTAASERAAEDRRASQMLQEGEFNPTSAATVAAGGGGSDPGGSGKGVITMEVWIDWLIHPL